MEIATLSARDDKIIGGIYGVIGIILKTGL